MSGKSDIPEELLPLIRSLGIDEQNEEEVAILCAGLDGSEVAIAEYLDTAMLEAQLIAHYKNQDDSAAQILEDVPEKAPSNLDAPCEPRVLGSIYSEQETQSLESLDRSAGGK